MKFQNSIRKVYFVCVLPFLVALPCRSIGVLSWLLSLGLLSWSSLSTRWMMHSRDLSTFSQTFSWKDTRNISRASREKKILTEDWQRGEELSRGGKTSVICHIPTPLHASPTAVKTDCSDHSIWLAACPGRFGGLPVLSLRRETL